MWKRWSEGARKGESRIGKEVRGKGRREKQKETWDGVWERWSEGAKKGESKVGKEVRRQGRREKERDDGRSEGGKVGEGRGRTGVGRYGQEGSN